MSECQGEAEGGQSGSAFESRRSHALSRSALRGMSWNTGWSSGGPRFCRLNDITIVLYFLLICYYCHPEDFPARWGPAVSLTPTDEIRRYRHDHWRAYDFRLMCLGRALL